MKAGGRKDEILVLVYGMSRDCESAQNIKVSRE